MLQLKDRLSFFYIQRGTLAVIDGCLVLTDNEDQVQYEVPARATTCIMVGRVPTSAPRRYASPPPTEFCSPGSASTASAATPPAAPGATTSSGWTSR